MTDESILERLATELADLEHHERLAVFIRADEIAASHYTDEGEDPRA